jgi:ABC-type oligopeptide transport system substrate-binding subunit
VTATDFEWTWKRNLDPATGSTSASLLFDVVGAREFNLGIDPNPDHVGIHARDNFTLEVLLAEPVAYFPFIVTMPVTFPIPRSAVERYGRDWWRPGHILSNGPYQLVEFDAQHKCAVERRAGYLALAGGNTRRIEWIIIDDHESRLQAYLEGRLDLTELPTFLIPEGFPSQETLPSPALQVASLLFNPAKPPLDNPRVRKALVHALDRRSIYEPYNRKIAQGGLVPEGMPGHSPDIGLRYNRELSLRYLAEAGYPGGRNFPRLTLIGPTRFIQHFAEQYAKQWRENLGIEVDFSASDPLSPQESRKQQLQGSIIFYGWVADYPDPDNFLRLSEMVSVLKLMGWEDPTYDELVIKASRATDRGRRMEMYRQADRILVNEQTLVLPVTYGTSFPLKFLLKPWVKNFKPTLLGGLLNQDIFVEEH